MNEQYPAGAGIPTLQPTMPRTAGVAIASLVLGILGILCFGLLTGIPAVILGIVALNKIAGSQGLLTGKGMAITGLVLGALSLVSSMLLAAMLLPAVSKARMRAQETVCAVNTRQIGIACITFASENENRLPATLDDLKPYVGGEDALKKLLICPFQKASTTPCYEFLEAGKKLSELDDPSRTPIIREIQPHPSGSRSVCFADGHTESQRP